MSFSIIMIIKKIFSVILRLSNNTKYHRPAIPGLFVYPEKGHQLRRFSRKPQEI